MPSPSLTLIVAATQTNGIGLAGGLPWKLPGEMRYFAKVTTEGCGATSERPNAVIMGRKTWDGIPERFRPLKGRRNVVLSRAATDASANAQVEDGSSTTTTHHPSLSSALASPELQTANQTFLIGGAQIYDLALSPSPPSSPAAPLADRILLTRILSPAFPDCDAFFPEVRRSGAWERATSEALDAWVGWTVPRGVQREKDVEYEFEMWVRTGRGGDA